MASVWKVPSSSAGAMRLAAYFARTLIMLADSSTASFMALTGSEPILLMPPDGAGTRFESVGPRIFSGCSLSLAKG